MLEGREAFRYDLPAELIAQDPPERRGDSRLLLVEPGRGPLAHRPFNELADLLRPDDVLVLNDSRVLPARLCARRLRSGGRVEFLLIRPEGSARTWRALARPTRRLQQGERFYLETDAGRSAAPDLLLVEKLEEGEVLVQSEVDPGELAETWGQVPLPPYIRRRPGDEAEAARADRDRRRYQTVYAVADPSGAGSAAAPTAGLHFTDRMLERLTGRGVGLARIRLHVGLGTFRPPTARQWEQGRLHEEWFHLPATTAALIERARRCGGRVIAVGTTSLRVLETVAGLGLSDDGPECRGFSPETGNRPPVFDGLARRSAGHWEIAGRTRLFIRPPQKIVSVDGLLTNFHLPGSSLLMLVAALIGTEAWREVYRVAVQERLRFFSYGDCMLSLPGGREAME